MKSYSKVKSASYSHCQGQIQRQYLGLAIAHCSPGKFKVKPGNQHQGPGQEHTQPVTPGDVLPDSPITEAVLSAAVYYFFLRIISNMYQGGHYFLFYKIALILVEVGYLVILGTKFSLQSRDCALGQALAWSYCPCRAVHHAKHASWEGTSTLGNHLTP